jgi:hypothetical protein
MSPLALHLHVATGGKSFDALQLLYLSMQEPCGGASDVLGLSSESITFNIQGSYFIVRCEASLRRRGHV